MSLTKRLGLAALCFLLIGPRTLRAQDDLNKPTVQETTKYVVHFYNTWTNTWDFAGEYDNEDEADARMQQLFQDKKSGDVPYIGDVTVQSGTKRITTSPPPKPRPIQTNQLPPKPSPPGGPANPIEIQSIKPVDVQPYNPPSGGKMSYLLHYDNEPGVFAGLTREEAIQDAQTTKQLNPRRRISITEHPTSGNLTIDEIRKIPGRTIYELP